MTTSRSPAVRAISAPGLNSGRAARCKRVSSTRAIRAQPSTSDTRSAPSRASTGAIHFASSLPIARRAATRAARRSSPGLPPVDAAELARAFPLWSSGPLRHVQVLKGRARPREHPRCSTSQQARDEQRRQYCPPGQQSKVARQDAGLENRNGNAGKRVPIARTRCPLRAWRHPAPSGARHHPKEVQRALIL